MGEQILMAINGSLDSHDDVSVHINGFVKENENLNVDFLDDLDSYWDDINDRLVISRMVSDSFIRGVVNAVESEAAEKIAQKELEVSRLRDALLLYHVGDEENGTSQSHFIHESCSDNPGLFIEHGQDQEVSLDNLKTAAKNQLELLFKALNNIRRCNSVNGTDTDVEILGLGSSPRESGPEKWNGVDKMLNSLKGVLGAAVEQVNVEPFSLWQRDNDCLEEIQCIVVASFVQSHLKEEYEQRSQEKNVDFYGSRSLLLEKIKEVEGLRHELELISKFLSGHENGHHTLNGGIEVGEENNQKKADPLHRKISGCHFSSSSLWDSNGKQDDSVTSMSESYDTLKHLSHDDLISHFKTEMNQMKREHDYRIQEMTEDYFSLKREYLNLKERGSFSSLKRDKEFDALRRKIPDVISKLDKILLENEKFVSAEKNNADLKSRLDTLLLENCQLRDLLMEMKRESNNLSSQVSDATKKTLQLSQAEENLRNVIRKLESDVEDSHIEAFISDKVYGCFVEEFMNQIRCMKEETDLENLITGEVFELISRDIIASRQSSESKDDLEESCVESLMTEECCEVIYKEALKEACEKLEELNMKYISESKIRVSLEMHVSEKEDALRLGLLEKERLKQDIHSLENLVKEKENLVLEAENSLAKESKKLKIAFQEICNLRDRIHQQEIEILEKKEKLEFVAAQALERNKSYEVKISELRQELVLARETVEKIGIEKMMLLDIKHETEKKLLEKEEEERALRKQFESIVIVSSELYKNFNNIEHRVAEKTIETNSRLKSLYNQLSYLSQQAANLKGRALSYKQRLEKKCCDLQKAEAEVDLLGDEVESLLDLLEKIYIALDHYSPILKHYPGIIDILKLVRRELSGESKRAV
ncbi:PREDICTED: WPP domain-associated protein [Tarenaya hassleriana]|uniref:WPP domain-associated protein n=1 Tax=Tarenaya hassleriana TaxID=28532 RepID=UPI00053C9CF8|nr:PREDICTED: WPP domain-associated protein [Tarenaya hassleriana]XP_010540651.1 PREDICTED: WPP domain-associated protein [Tarenaya hassleriana]XP_019058169.1 PREDICTED: WPP domain-associated protein [Tarenaya hassleriana]